MRKTFRDEIAVAAMQALIPASATEPGRVARCEIIANLAYLFADAMIAQSKTQPVDTKEEQPTEE